jgi:ATP-dependent Lon protease
MDDKSILGVVTSPKWPELRPKASKALHKELLKAFEKQVQVNPNIPMEVLNGLDSSVPLQELLFVIAPFIEADVHSMQVLLDSMSLEEAVIILLDLLKSHDEVLHLNRRIEQELRHKVQKGQREYLIQEQMKKLSEELEDQEFFPEIAEFKKQLKEETIPKILREKLEKEVKRLTILQAGSPEYSVTRNYIETCLSIPFGKYSQDHLKITKLRKELNAKHFGLEKVKERFVEHAAVLSRGQKEEAPVLCLIGPPGVGKTTLARSVAKSLGREYIRISLGGVRDEAEIRGHRKTYIGAMPGRIIDALRKAKVMNPLILLDEIDKMASDFRGDPASALLEVLDAEQNTEFTDHFLEAGVDLSRVLFFTTANTEEGIPGPLLDRMEMIRISGYHHHEKVEIAKRHLLPKVCEKNGVTFPAELHVSDENLESIVQGYTREAGVRQLEQVLDKLARKRTLDILTKKKYPTQFNDKSLLKYLGIPHFAKRKLPDALKPGTALGLAYTPAGGDVLFIEVCLLQGKGHLKLTGSLGEVMKESAAIAMTLVKERASIYGVAFDLFKKTDVHIHFPEGAIPKDGPSAGIGLTCAIMSAFLRQALPQDMAFTGEVSLRGQIHAIGGLPEKSLAALESGVTEICIPQENEPHAKELPKLVRKGLKINKFDHIDAVLRKLFSSKGKKA